MSVNTNAVLTYQVSQIPQKFMCYTAKQGFYNYRAVTLVTDKLDRHWYQG